MTNRLFIIGAVIVAAIYILFSSLYVVDEREQAIVMRFGQITDVRTEPGIYFKIPTDVVDSVQIIEDRLAGTSPKIHALGAGSVFEIASNGHSQNGLRIVGGSHA